MTEPKPFDWHCRWLGRVLLAVSFGWLIAHLCAEGGASVFAVVCLWFIAARLAWHLSEPLQ